MTTLVKKNNYSKQISIIAFPIIIQGLVLQIQGVVNRMFLGNLKSENLSILGNTLFPFNASMSVLLAISTGLTIITAQKKGAGKIEDVKKFFISSILFNSILSLCVFFFWFEFSEIVYLLMGIDDSLIDYCSGYVKLLELFVIFYGIDMSVQSVLHGFGITKPIMYASFIKVFLNIFFSWVLIFGNCGFPKLGVYGSALSTSIANIIATLFLVTYFIFSGKVPFSIKTTDLLNPKLMYFIEIIKVGLPTGFETFSWYIGNLLLIKLLNSLDQLAVAIYTLTYGIEVLLYAIYNGIAKASLALIGHKIGENNIAEARTILSSCIKYNLLIMFPIFLLCSAFSNNILSLFTKDTQLIDKAVVFLIISAFTLFPKSMNVIVGNGIRGMGNTKWMLFTQIIGTVFTLAISSFLVLVLHTGIMGIYLTIFFDELIRAVLNIIYFYKKDTNTMKKAAPIHKSSNIKIDKLLAVLKIEKHHIVSRTKKSIICEN